MAGQRRPWLFALLARQQAHGHQGVAAVQADVQRRHRRRERQAPFDRVRIAGRACRQGQRHGDARRRRHRRHRQQAHAAQLHGVRRGGTVPGHAQVAALQHVAVQLHAGRRGHGAVGAAVGGDVAERLPVPQVAAGVQAEGEGPRGGPVGVQLDGLKRGFLLAGVDQGAHQRRGWRAGTGRRGVEPHHAAAGAVLDAQRQIVARGGRTRLGVGQDRQRGQRDRRRRGHARLGAGAIQRQRHRLAGAVEHAQIAQVGGLQLRQHLGRQGQAHEPGAGRQLQRPARGVLVGRIGSGQRRLESGQGQADAERQMQGKAFHAASLSIRAVALGGSGAR